MPTESLAAQLDLLPFDLFQKVEKYIDWRYQLKLKMKWDVFRAWRWCIERRKSLALVNRARCDCARCRNGDVAVDMSDVLVCCPNGMDSVWL